MEPDLLPQAAMILVTVFFFLAMRNIPQKLLIKFRYRNRASFQSRCHFILGTQLLAKARSATSRSSRTSLIAQSIFEAEKAITIDPKDAASHILKSLALDSFEVAVSPLAKKSLSDLERGDGLYKRAELKIAVGKKARVDSAIEDFIESVRICEESKGKAFKQRVEVSLVRTKWVEGVSSAVDAEALLLGMELAMEMKFQSVTFYSDSLQALWGVEGRCWEAYGCMLIKWHGWKLAFISRNKNLMADHFTKKAKKAREEAWKWDSVVAIPRFVV